MSLIDLLTIINKNSNLGRDTFEIEYAIYTSNNLYKNLYDNDNSNFYNLNNKFNSINTDTINQGSNNRFIINDTYNRNINFTNSLTVPNIITSNLKITNDIYSIPLIIKQNNNIYNIAEFYNNNNNPSLIISANGFIGINKNSGIQERLDIDGNIKIKGNIYPETDITYDLGTSNNRFKDLYLSGNSINLDNLLISKNVSNNLEIKDNEGNYKNLNLNQIELNNGGIKLSVQLDNLGNLIYKKYDNITGTNILYPAVYTNQNETSNSVSSNVMVSYVSNTSNNLLSNISDNSNYFSNLSLTNSNNLANYTSNSSNNLNNKFNSINTDTIIQGTSNRFIINDIYNRNITFTNTLTTSNIITSNLNVIGDTTTLNTTVYQTEQLQVINDTTATALIVKQINSNKNVAEFYYQNNQLGLIINSNGNIGIGITNPLNKFDIIGNINSTSLSINNIDISTTISNNSNYFSNLSLTNSNNLANYTLNNSNYFSNLSLTNSNNLINYSSNLSLTNSNNLANYTLNNSNYFSNLSLTNSNNLANYTSNNSNLFNNNLLNLNANNITTGTLSIARGGSKWNSISNNISYLSGNVNVNSLICSFGSSNYIPNSTYKSYIMLRHNTFNPSIGLNFPNPECAILMMNDSSSKTLPWGFYNGVVKYVATSTPFGSLRYDIGYCSINNTVESNSGVNTFEPLLSVLYTGNIGIGTSLPINKLDVVGNINSSEYLKNNINISNIFVSSNVFNNSSNILFNYSSNNSNIFDNKLATLNINTDTITQGSSNRFIINDIYNRSISFTGNFLTSTGPINSYDTINFYSSITPASLTWSSRGVSALGVANTSNQLSLNAIAGDMVLRSDSNNKLILQNGSNNASLIISNNFIGIGTTRPLYNLDVNSNINSSEYFIKNLNISNIFVSSNVFLNNSNSLFNYSSNNSNTFNNRLATLNINTDTITQGSSNRFIVNDIYNRDITFTNSLTSSNIITSNLSVIGDTTTFNTTIYQTEQLQVVNDTTATALIVKQVNSNKNVAEYYYQNNKLGLLINSNGNIGIGITNPLNKLDIIGNINSSDLLINGTSIQTTITNNSNNLFTIINDNYSKKTTFYFTPSISYVYNSITYYTYNIEISKFVRFLQLSPTIKLAKFRIHISPFDSNFNGTEIRECEYLIMMSDLNGVLSVRAIGTPQDTYLQKIQSWKIVKSSSFAYLTYISPIQNINILCSIIDEA
jgi:hypothetical protein